MKPRTSHLSQSNCVVCWKQAALFQACHSISRCSELPLSPFWELATPLESTTPHIPYTSAS